MTPQLAYALRRVAVMIALAVLGVIGSEYAGLIKAAGLDPTLFSGIIGAAIAAAVRAVEGYRDGQRAEEGRTIPEDVTPVPLALRS